MSDEVINTSYYRGKVQLHTRSNGDVEVDYPDVFFLPKTEGERLPLSWREGAQEEGAYLRVPWPEEAYGSRKARLRYFYDAVFQPKGIEPLEADVDPAQRFLIEHPKVQIATDWKLLYFDIETEQIIDWERPWADSRILSFSWRSSTGLRGHVRASAKTDEAEREVLRTFARLADRHDVLLAWAGDRFDNKMISSRCAMLDVPFDRWAYHWIDHLKLFKRYFLRTEDGGVTQSFALGSIAEALLGRTKVPVEMKARELGWDGKSNLFEWVWEQTPQLLEEYNDEDVELMHALEEKTGFIKLHLALCGICRVLPGMRSLFPMTLVDGKMLQQGFATGYHFPSRPVTEAEWHQAKGAYVPQAQVGLHEGIAVLDYSRMYPSIITTFNMSLETCHPDGDLKVPETDEEGRPTGRVLASFRSDTKGHLPAALEDIIQARKQYSQRQSEAEVGSAEFHDAGRLSTACKVLANTFYGVILSSMSRFYRQEIGESVTSFGRYLLANTIREAEKRGHRLVFGDTDSVAIKADDQAAEALKATMNSSVIPELLRRAGVDPERSDIAIDFEKRYSRVVVTASKRYAGKFSLYKGKAADKDAPMDIRGLEIVRSDVCRAARVLQRAVLERVLDGVGPEDLWEEIRNERDSFWKDEIDVNQLVMAKGLSQPLNAYKTEPLQVKVAKRMSARGEDIMEGSKIPYLMTLSGPRHPSELQTEDSIDRVTYWNKHVYPATQRVLEASFNDRGWERLLFQKNVSPDQLDLFGNEIGRPRKVRKVRKVRKIRKAVRPVVLSFQEETLDQEAAQRLKRTLQAYPGPCPVIITVTIPGKAVVEMEPLPEIRVADPAIHATLGHVLRTMGAKLVRPGSPSL